MGSNWPWNLCLALLDLAMFLIVSLCTPVWGSGRDSGNVCIWVEYSCVYIYIWIHTHTYIHRETHEFLPLWLLLFWDKLHFPAAMVPTSRLSFLTSETPGFYWSFSCPMWQQHSLPLSKKNFTEKRGSQSLSVTPFEVLTSIFCLMFGHFVVLLELFIF